MLDKVQTRLSIIIIVLVTALYLLWPTYQLYGIKNSSDNIDYIKSLEKDAIGLGLDLKGGLRIILELDNKTFLQRLIKQNLSKQSINHFEKILEESLNNSIRNQSDLILELSFREREPSDSKVIVDVLESVNYWKKYLKK